MYCPCLKCRSFLLIVPGSFWVSERQSVQFTFIVCLHLSPRLFSKQQEEKGRDPINQYNPSLVCSYQANNWISIYLCHGQCCDQWFEVRAVCPFCYNCRNFLPSLNKHQRSKTCLPLHTSCNYLLFLVRFGLVQTLVCVDHCLSFFRFSFGYCIAFPFSIYGFLLHHWHLQSFISSPIWSWSWLYGSWVYNYSWAYNYPSY